MTKLLIFMMLPIALTAQTFEEIGETLCQANQQAVILFGDNSKMVKLIESQPEMEGRLIYKLKYKSDMGKRLGVSMPMMYLFDRNMVLLNKAELSSRGWKQFKKSLDTKPSKDCLITALPEPKAAEIPASDKVSQHDEGPQVDLKPVRQPMTSKELDAQLVADKKKQQQQAMPKTAEPKPLPKIVPKPMNEDIPADLGAAQFYTVQLGVYVNQENARRKEQQEREIVASTHYGYVPSLGKNAYIVTAGLFPERAAAQQWAKKLGGFAIKANELIR